MTSRDNPTARLACGRLDRGAGSAKRAKEESRLKRVSKAIDALAERGIRAEIHRQESGRLVPDVVGEVVDGWGDEEGPWVTVMPELRALTSTGTAES